MFLVLKRVSLGMIVFLVVIFVFFYFINMENVYLVFFFVFLFFVEVIRFDMLGFFMKVNLVVFFCLYWKLFFSVFIMLFIVSDFFRLKWFILNIDN